MKHDIEFEEEALVLIGEGSRRRCYRLPDDPAHCVKFYRLPSEYTSKTTLSVRLHIGLGRFWPRWNVNCQEWRYHQTLCRRLPADLASVFPEQLVPIFSPKRGWGIAESLMVNWDGSPVQRVIDEIKRAAEPEMKRRLFDAAARLFAQMAEHSVCFYDPPNVMVQWSDAETFRLRIVDFEPRGRALVPGLSHIPPYVRCKVRRRCQRYLARLAEACGRGRLSPQTASSLYS